MAVNRGNFALCATQNGTYVEFKAKSIKQTNESLATEDSGRTDSGKMVINWIKPKLRKWEITIPECDSAEVYKLFSMIQGQTYWIKIFDLSTGTGQSPTDGSVQTVKVYTSNTEADCYSGVINSKGLYQGITFSAIEMG